MFVPMRPRAVGDASVVTKLLLTLITSNDECSTYLKLKGFFGVATLLILIQLSLLSHG